MCHLKGRKEERQVGKATVRRLVVSGVEPRQKPRACNCQHCSSLIKPVITLNKCQGRNTNHGASVFSLLFKKNFRQEQLKSERIQTIMARSMQHGKPEAAVHIVPSQEAPLMLSWGPPPPLFCLGTSLMEWCHQHL